MRTIAVAVCASMTVTATARAQVPQLQRPQGMELCAYSRCTAHLATEPEIEQILRHPLFALSPDTFDKITKRQTVIADRRARAAAEEDGPLGGFFSALLARTGHFEIGYPNYDAFIKAQSQERQKYLIPNLNGIRVRADETFSSALRDYLDNLERNAPGQGATAQHALSVFLGNHLLDCWRKPSEKTSQSIDEGGLLIVQREVVNNVTQSCFNTMREDRSRFADLVQVREWHPYLWDSMSKTYAYLRTFLTPAERAKLPPIPQPLLVDQNAFASVSGVGERVVEPTSEAVTPPVPKQSLAGLISSDDYPMDALRQGEQGTVGVRITVSPRGVMETAAVIRSSGSRSLDAATLRIVRSRVTTTYPKFEPARDEKGYPVRGTIDKEFTWSMSR